jgi:periplasmic copper chaperone A
MRTRIAALALSLTLGFATEAVAQESRVGELVVEAPWARATASPAMPGAAYLTVANHGTVADTLTAVASPIAERAELHTSQTDGGVTKMRSVAAVEVAPGASVVFAPSGLHIMLHGLEQPLTEGDRFPLALTFENAGSVTVEVVVRPLGAMGSGHGAMSHDGHS